MRRFLTIATIAAVTACRESDEKKLERLRTELARDSIELSVAAAKVETLTVQKKQAALQSRDSAQWRRDSVLIAKITSDAQTVQDRMTIERRDMARLLDCDRGDRRSTLADCRRP
jgi:hypothetical protein